jgi:hypothetical protein
MNRLRGFVFVAEPSYRISYTRSFYAGIGGRWRKKRLGRNWPCAVVQFGKVFFAVGMVISDVLAFPIFPVEQILMRVVVSEERGFVAESLQREMEIGSPVGDGAFVIDRATAVRMGISPGEHGCAGWHALAMLGKVVGTDDRLSRDAVETGCGTERVPAKSGAIGTHFVSSD